MHRHVRGVGDQHAVGVEQRAGEVEPLLHVDRVGGVLQRDAHLLGDRHEEVVEHLEHDRVGARADRGLAGERLDPAQHQVVARGELGLPAGLDHDGGGRLDDDRRPPYPVARTQPLALQHRRREALGRLMRRARGHHHHLVDRPERIVGRAGHERPLGLVDLGHVPDRLDRDLLDHQRAALDHEAVARPVLGLERLEHLRRAARRNLERRVGAAVADVDPRRRRDPVGRQVLLAQLVAALRRELLDRLGEPRHQRLLEPGLDRPLTERAHVGKPHAVGREHARQRVHQDPLQPEGVGDPAGVLAGGAAEAAQHVAGDVVAALNRDLLDRVRHVVDRDREAAVRDLLGSAPGAGRRLDLGRELPELLPRELAIERLIRLRPEHLGEEARMELADHQVGVGHGQRAALAVAGRARVGAGGFRADPETGAVEVEDRAAARGHGVDRHHRRPHAHARDLRLEGPLVLAGVVGDVGRGAPHVEGDDLREAGERADPDRADDAAGRPGQDRILALEPMRVDQAAARLHEHQADLAERVRHPVDVAPQDRREIGVDHGGVAAADQLHERRDPMADRDLGEADRARHLGERRLVGVVAVAVHQHDGERAQALAVGGAEIGPGALHLERALDRAVGAHPLLDLDHLVVEQLGQHDPAREDVRAMLVADPERVAEPLGDRQYRRLAAALEERVGGDRRAHLDRVDPRGRQRLLGAEPEQIPDPLQRGVPVVVRVVGQELVHRERAVRRAADDVGEGAAAVDPELPACVAVRHPVHSSRRHPAAGSPL